MAVENLKSLPLRDLVELAKRRGVRGWHEMRKEQLVRALAKSKPARAAKRAPAAKSLPKGKTARAGKAVPSNGVCSVSRNGSVGHVKSPMAARPKSAPPAKSPIVRHPSQPAAKKLTAKPTTQKQPAKPAVVSKPIAAVRVAPAPKPKPRPKSPVVVRRLTEAKVAQNRFKNLAFRTPPGQPNGFKKDRLIVMVRDPYWLHAYWELSRHGIARAEAALGQDWHTARPVLRLLDVSSGGTTSTAERVIRHIDVHGGVNNWYVDVQDPPRSYRLDIGYLTSNDRFFMLARSNVVTPPQAAATDALDENWSDVAENFDRIYAMSGGYAIDGSANELQELFEERLRRPMGQPMLARMGAGIVAGTQRKREFVFELDAELIVYGRSEPSAHVMLQGEPITLRPDGTFTVRYSMPNCRQVIPAVASSADGVEQRTIVLAVERNTKVMEPVTRDSAE
ncbi:MAG: DUF4912 domain-containing protein [Pirellulales bacterium]|nr:DUF4912 domain-containing protein [Pirellulales bacterium]